MIKKYWQITRFCDDNFLLLFRNSGTFNYKRTTGKVNFPFKAFVIIFRYVIFITVGRKIP